MAVSLLVSLERLAAATIPIAMIIMRTPKDLSCRYQYRAIQVANDDGSRKAVPTREPLRWDASEDDCS